MTDIRNALNDLPTIAPESVSVSSSGSQYIITFNSDLGTTFTLLFNQQSNITARLAETTVEGELYKQIVLHQILSGHLCSQTSTVGLTFTNCASLLFILFFNTSNDTVG